MKNGILDAVIKMQNMISLGDWSAFQIEGLLQLALAMKKHPGGYKESMKGKHLALIFEKPSLRTRVSFEAGMIRMGGAVTYLDAVSAGLNRGHMRDEAMCLAGYVNIIAARVFKHGCLKEMAEAANNEGVPVINALSDLEHPCQILADLLTMRELKGTGKIRVAYIGDGNNVCNSLIVGCSKLGIEIAVATPEGYGPADYVKCIGMDCGALTLTKSPEEAVKGADFVYTDTWVSMGQESEAEKRVSDFKGFTVTKKLLGDAYFMHCLPAHRGFEVTEEVIDSKQSVIYEQAKNRLPAQQALMVMLLKQW